MSTGVLASHFTLVSARYGANAPLSHCCPTSQSTASGAGCAPTVCWASSASDCRQTPSYVGSALPYSPVGNALVGDGEGDGDSAARATGAKAAPITAVAASTAALRRTFMIGGCLSLRGAGQPRAPGGSAPYASTVPVTGGSR